MNRKGRRHQRDWAGVVIPEGGTVVIPRGGRGPSEGGAVVIPRGGRGPSEGGRGTHVQVCLRAAAAASL